MDIWTTGKGMGSKEDDGFKTLKSRGKMMYTDSEVNVACKASEEAE